MKDQFRVERYEMQLMRIRYLSVGMMLYAVGALFVYSFLSKNLWLLFGGAAVVLLVFWFLSGMVGGTIGKKSKNGKEFIYLPIVLAGILISLILADIVFDSTELVWVETFLLALALATNIYAIYLMRYIRFVYANRDADYMAVYHVTLGNTRAYRLWYLFTVLAVLSVAILPIWNPFDNLWGRIKTRSRTDNTVTVTPTPDTSVPDSSPEVEPDANTTPERPPADLKWLGTLIKIVVSVMIVFAGVLVVRSMLVRITDAKTSMETDRIIDLKRVLIAVPDETVRTRDDTVLDENTYARRIRRTFKRTVFDRFGNEDIPELTPTALLGNRDENEDVLLEKYEKARYSDIPCTADDVKAVKEPKK